jgi:hypothetical protein
MIFGDRVIPVDEFILKFGVPDKSPAAGSTWRPIRHGSLIGDMYQAAADRGWVGNMSDARYSISPDGLVMATYLMLNIGQPKIMTHSETRLQIWPTIGILNSNNRRRSLQVYFGQRIQSEGKWFGVVMEKLLSTRRHTSGVDCQELMKFVFDQIYERRNRHNEYLSYLDGIRSRVEADSIMLTMARRKNIPWAGIALADSYLKAKTHITCLDTLRAISHAIQHNNPLKQMDDLYDLRQLMPEPAPSWYS